MKKIIAIILLICTLGLVSCEPSQYEKDQEKTLSLGTGASVLASERDTKTNKNNVGYVELCIEGYGRVVFLLDITAAPETVKNFVGLIKGGYYDTPNGNDGKYHGNTFHIVDQGRLLQGGCPNHDGTGTLENKIVGEFAENGWTKNDISHKKGAISMVLENDPNSAACQFFICMKDMPELDGKYAAFGYVIQGMSVLEEVMRDYSKYADAEQAGIIFEKENQPVIRYFKAYMSADNHKWEGLHN